MVNFYVSTDPLSGQLLLEHLQPANIVEELRKLVLQYPQFAYRAANVFNSMKHLLEEDMLMRLAIVDESHWEELFRLGVSDVKQYGELSESTKAAIEDLGLRINLKGLMVIILKKLIEYISRAIVEGGLIQILSAAIFFGLVIILSLQLAVYVVVELILRWLAQYNMESGVSTA